MVYVFRAYREIHQGDHRHGLALYDQDVKHCGPRRGAGIPKYIRPFQRFWDHSSIRPPNSPPSTLPCSVHWLHFLTEVTLPQEQTRVLWVPARAARKHLIEIELEAEGYPFSFLFFCSLAFLTLEPYFATTKPPTYNADRDLSSSPSDRQTIRQSQKEKRSTQAVNRVLLNFFRIESYIFLHNSIDDLASHCASVTTTAFRLRPLLNLELRNEESIHVMDMRVEPPSEAQRWVERLAAIFCEPFTSKPGPSIDEHDLGRFFSA